MIKTFRKKPVEIQAMQFNIETIDDCKAWLNSNGQAASMGAVGEELSLDIPTLEGTMTASDGDWIIRGVKNEFYPCKPDIFEATYDEVV